MTMLTVFVPKRPRRDIAAVLLLLLREVIEGAVYWIRALRVMGMLSQLSRATVHTCLVYRAVRVMGVR